MGMCGVVAPGDVLHFTSCKFEWCETKQGKAKKMVRQVGDPHHTAVVESVVAPDDAATRHAAARALQVFEQNEAVVRDRAVHRAWHVPGDLSEGTLQLWRARTKVPKVRWPYQ